MSSFQTFQKALLVLDKKNEQEKGYALLEDAAKQAQNEDNIEILVASYAVRSEILYENKKYNECRVLLSEAEELVIPEYLGDAMDYELSVINKIKMLLNNV